MITNAKPMACGGCGKGLFRMYQQKTLLDEVTLLAECTGCKSVSTITASRPTVQIGWTEGSTGRLTQMEPTP